MENGVLHMPCEVVLSNNGGSSIANIIVSTGKHRVLLLTDKGVFGTGKITSYVEILKTSGIEVFVINDIPSEPECEQIIEISDRACEYGAELMLAIGGGSVMDTAKLVSAILTNPDFASNILDASTIKNPSLPVIMVPTTAGTGSEATQNAIVLVKEQQLKVGIIHLNFLPGYVVLDPDLTTTLPKHITAATGIDALCHAIETLISRKANSISRTFSFAAIKLIYENLRKCYDNGNDREARANMLLAAFYSGVCINSSSTVAVHALAYPLGGSYHIPHGVSNAMLLAEVLKFNMSACINEYAQIAETIGVGNGETDENKAAMVIDEICKLIRYVGIPTDITVYNVSYSEIDFLVDSAAKVTRLLDQNPRAITKPEIRNIYERLFPKKN